MKTNVLRNEPIAEYLAERVVKKSNGKLPVATIDNLIKKYFEEVIDDVLENGTFTLGSMKIGVHKVPTLEVERKMRKYYVIPSYGSAYSYTVRFTFTDWNKGTYYLKPSREVLAKLRKKLNESPDRNLKLRRRRCQKNQLHQHSST